MTNIAGVLQLLICFFVIKAGADDGFGGLCAFEIFVEIVEAIDKCSYSDGTDGVLDLFFLYKFHCN
jgi:hypothetical protein